MQTSEITVNRKSLNHKSFHKPNIALSFGFDMFFENAILLLRIHFFSAPSI